MVKIKGDGFYLSRSNWESDDVFIILNELIRSGYITGYHAERSREDIETIVISVNERMEVEK